MRAGFFSTTQKYSVGTSAGWFEVMGAPAARKAYYMVSDTVVYLRRDGEDATVDEGMRVPPDLPILVECFVGDFVSFIGEADGNLWATEIDRT